VLKRDPDITQSAGGEDDLGEEIRREMAE